jgi:tight adherence protein B
MTGRLHVLRRAVVGVLLTLLALSLWGSAPASAADNAAIDHALPTDGAVRLLVSVPGLDEVDLTGVKVTIAGTDVTSEAATASSSSAVARTSVLAIDTSESMAGTRIAEAKKAALAYLAAVPANVKVGVLTFDDTVKVVLPPALDRTAARAAVAGLTLTRNTALYDGVLGALEAAGPSGETAGQRKILLLSDGKDTTGTDLQGVLSTIKKSGATVDVVSLQRGDEANAPLNAIASAGKGTMIAASDPAVLTAAFAKEADALARQLVVTAQIPKGFDKVSSNVSVTVPTSAQSFTASAYLPVRRAADIKADQAALSGPRPVTAGPLDLSANVMYGAVGAIGLGLVGLVLILATTSNRPATNLTLKEQMQAYGVMSVPGQSGPRRDAVAPNPFTGGAREAAERALANNKNLEARIAHSLEGAGMSIKPSEWLLLRAGITVGGGLLGVLLGSGSIPLGMLFILASVIGPWFYLRTKRSRRLNAFGTGLADTLQLMSGSLSAGLSLAQSIDTIVREGAEPIAGEFRRVVIETRLGVTLEDSMEGVAERMSSRDFEWVVMAIRIQREVGGNLAELLLTVAATLREREYLRRHVRALSAEGRLSCYVLGGLPPGFLLYLTLSKPDYVHPLYSTPIGWILMTVTVLLLVVGMFWMTKVSKVDV